MCADLFSAAPHRGTFCGIATAAFAMAVATTFSNLNVDPEVVSSDSVGLGLLGFLFFFISAASAYVDLLPRAELDFPDAPRPDME